MKILGSNSRLKIHVALMVFKIVQQFNFSNSTLKKELLEAGSNFNFMLNFSDLIIMLKREIEREERELDELEELVFLFDELIDSYVVLMSLNKTNYRY